MASVKRALVCAAAVLVSTGLGAGVGVVAPSGSVAAPPVAAAAKVKTFKNCTALNKTYKHGVKKSSSTKDVVKSNGKTIKKSSSAKTSTALYNANKKLDRDKDGIACEK